MGSATSSISCARLELMTLTFDFAQLGFSIFLRSFIRMGFLPLVYGISKLDSLLFVLDFAPWMQMQTLRVKINVCVDMNVCVCVRVLLCSMSCSDIQKYQVFEVEVQQST